MYITKIPPLNLIHSLLPGPTPTFKKEPRSLVRPHTFFHVSQLQTPFKVQIKRQECKKKNRSDSCGTPRVRRLNTFYPLRASTVRRLRPLEVFAGSASAWMRAWYRSRGSSAILGEFPQPREGSLATSKSWDRFGKNLHMWSCDTTVARVAPRATDDAAVLKNFHPQKKQLPESNTSWLAGDTFFCKINKK